MRVLLSCRTCKWNNKNFGTVLPKEILRSSGQTGSWQRWLMDFAVSDNILLRIQTVLPRLVQNEVRQYSGQQNLCRKGVNNLGVVPLLEWIYPLHLLPSWAAVFMWWRWPQLSWTSQDEDKHPRDSCVTTWKGPSPSLGHHHPTSVMVMLNLLYDKKQTPVLFES